MSGSMETKPHPDPSGEGEGAVHEAAGDDALFEFTRAWPLGALPSTCACCNEAASVVRVTRRHERVGHRGDARSLRVPYCPFCAAHLDAGHVRRAKHAVAATALGVASAWAAVAARPFLLPALAIVLGGCASLLALLALDGLRRAAPIARHRGCTTGEQEAFCIAGFDVLSATARLRGTNARWVGLVSSGESRTVHNIPGEPRWGRRAAVAALGALLSLAVWARSNGEVCFDNPTLETLTFEVDGGERTLVLAPGDRDTLFLPSGTRTIVVLRRDREVDRIRGEVGHGSTHAVTPLGIACYRAVDATVGAGDPIAPLFFLEPMEHRWHDLYVSEHVFARVMRAVHPLGDHMSSARNSFVRVECGGDTSTAKSQPSLAPLRACANRTVDAVVVRAPNPETSGSAAIRSLFAGCGLDPSRLRQDFDNPQGPSVDQLEDDARAQGLPVVQRVLPPEQVANDPDELPALSIIVDRNTVRRFVLLWRADRGRVQVMDPIEGVAWFPSHELLDRLYRHELSVPMDSYRDWVRSESFQSPLRRRLFALHFSPLAFDRLLRPALDDGGWAGITALEAATRQTERAIRRGLFFPGPDAVLMTGRWFDCTRQPTCVGSFRAPDDAWIARPGPRAADGTEQVLLRGAIVLSLRDTVPDTSQ